MPNYVLGLGSNLANPLVQLRKAVSLIQKNNDVTISNYSSIYISEAVVPEDAPLSWNQPFLNAAILIYTAQSPDELLKTIKQIETVMGRAVEHQFWSPRIIDIDILCADYLVVKKDHLTIPHKELLNRPFALRPLLDVLPNWHHPKNIELDLNNYVKKLDSIEKIEQLVFGPEIMGILNVTPDSFSNDGLSFSTDATIDHFNHLVKSGAHIIDIGAESTSLKQKAEDVTEQIEWQRLKPIFDTLKSTYHKQLIKPVISLDSYRIETIQKAVDYDFVVMINDVMGNDLEQKAEILVSNPQLKYVVVDNWRGPLSYIGQNEKNDYDRVMAFAQYQVNALLSLGVNQSQLIFDPGFGFAKSSETVKYLTDRLQRIKQTLGMPILVGHSRKQSVINPTRKLTKSDATDLETSILSFHLIKKGVDILRVHEVDLSKRAAIISSFYQ